MQRRKLAAMIGASAAFAAAARAQQPDRKRRIGILHDYPEGDREGQAHIAAFRDELSRLGWIEGRTADFLYRAAATDSDEVRVLARQMVAQHPDVVLGAGATIVAALQRADRNVPVVFVNVTDPVGLGLVESLAQPGGSATGFTQFEVGIAAKWLEILKQIAPGIRRVAVVRDPTARSGGGQLGAIQAVAPGLGVELGPVDPESTEAIERGLAPFPRDLTGGLIVTTSRLARAHRDFIVSLAAQYRLPAIYPFRVYVETGGLASYGADTIEPYRRAAAYADRILRGEKAGKLPVQVPTKYDFIVNLKTARNLGLAIPERVLARTDGTIE